MAACPENISYILSVDFFELISVKDQIKSHRIDHQCFCLLNQNRRKFVKRNLRKTKLFASCKFFKFHDNSFLPVFLTSFLLPEFRP